MQIIFLPFLLPYIYVLRTRMKGGLRSLRGSTAITDMLTSKICFSSEKWFSKLYNKHKFPMKITRKLTLHLIQMIFTLVSSSFVKDQRGGNASRIVVIGLRV